MAESKSMEIPDEVLRRRDRDAFDGGFEAGKEYAADAIAVVMRLTDLVRHQRNELHDAKLISDKEFAFLVADSDSGKRVARLESYDGIRDRLKAAQDAIAVEKRALLAANVELREDAERMRVMREALEKARHKLCYHLLSDGEMKDFRCDSCKIIDAALASTAPVAEAGQKEGEPRVHQG